MQILENQPCDIKGDVCSPKKKFIIFDANDNNYSNCNDYFKTLQFSPTRVGNKALMHRVVLAHLPDIVQQRIMSQATFKLNTTSNGLAMVVAY
jgi:hypothetical protein